MAAKLIALILPLGLDTFAVAAALGALGASGKERLRISLLFCGFEAGMPLIGLAVGVPLGQAVGEAATYLAIVVLLGFGLYSLLARDDDERERLRRLARGPSPALLLLGLSISLDELAVGFTLGLLGLPVAVVIALIALQALIATQLGLRIGGRLSEAMREGAERVAGAGLVALALVLLVEEVLA